MLLKKVTLAILLLIFELSPYAQPLITSFSPATGPVGTIVTINGANFSTVSSNNIVYFGAAKATVTAATSTSITVAVPLGATYQPITVVVNGLIGYSSRSFIVTFSGGGQINSGSFEAKQDFTTDLRPNAVALSDFDGDGKTDIATPNDYSSAGFASISVLRNTSSSGNISFASKQDYVTGAVTYDIASGDIDGDGKPDIVSTSVADAVFSVFRNTGSAGTLSFAPKTNVNTTNAPYAVVIGDIDGDGKSDVVTLNSTSQTISVFRNTGSPGSVSFASKIDFSTLLSPQDIVLGDMDGDGKTDIAFTNKLSNSFSVYRNTSTLGNVSFASRLDYTCGSGNEPYGISVGDLDNDSKPDLVVVINNSTGGAAQLFRNLSSVGTISFAFNNSIWSGASNNTAYHAAINDINGDGKLDIALSVDGTTAGMAGVFQNNSSTGTFSFGAVNNFIASFAPYGIMLGDFEGDGKPDLVISEFTLERISVFKNKAGSPAITSFAPANANTGTTVTITGSNFTGVTAVSFGGIPATSFTVVNSTTINAVVGSGASGDISVVNAIGSGTKSGFVFAGPPIISSFTPTSGFTGTTITISGYNFNGATSVTFGGTAASSFSIVDPFTIIATVANGASGNVSVTTSYGTGTKSGFVYAPIPIINSFSPLSAGQGTMVTISGINFTGTTAVSFGGVPVASFTVVNSTTITAVVGNGASGDLVITNASGIGTKPGFSFIPAPIISSFSPSLAGTGTTVTITGNNFAGTSSVKFGGSNASSFTVVSSTTITAVVGGGTSGNVSVTTGGGTSGLAGFTFIPQPTINSFTPKITGAGGVVTITGTDLSTTNAVSFGGVAAASFTVVDSTTVTAVLSTGASGNVMLTTVGGNASSSGFNFTTAPIINSFSPTSGPVGTVVTIDGANFNPVLSNNTIYFGGAKANISSATLNRLTVTVPAGANYQPISITTNNKTAYSMLPFAVTFSGGGTFNASTFAGRVDFVTGGNPGSIASGDLDGDGKIDVAVANTYTNTISFFRNTSTVNRLSFAAKIDSIAAMNPHDIKIADIDGDGKPDVLLLNSRPPNEVVAGPDTATKVTIFRNTSTPGNLSFNQKITVTTPYPPYYLAIADFNLDGKPDLAVVQGNVKPDYISIISNTTTGGAISFGPLQNIRATNSSSETFWPGSISVADIDNDGDADLVIGFGVSDFISILSNQGVMQQQCTGSCWFGSGYANVSTADFDGDGNVDVLADDWILRNTFNGFSLYFDIRRQIGLGGVVAVDNLSGTAKPDFVRINPSANTVSAVKNLSTIGSLSFAANVDYNTGTEPSDVITADFNGDGKVDVAVTNKKFNTFSVLLNNIGNSGPSINAFSPTNGSAGTQVTITGTNLTGVTGVSFGGVAATSFTVVNPTTITAVVGNGGSGNVSVYTATETASLGWFYYAPSITSFTPTNAGTGITVTISGTNFTGATAVSFGGIAASSFTVLSSTTIAATVANGASGNVSVTTPAGSVTATGFTYVAAPTITSFTPATGGAGTTVTVTGTNLTGATSVQFGNTPATSFSVASSTSLTAVVGNGSTGNIFVTTPGGTAYSTIFTFIPAPTITSFSPTSGIAGTTVTINGTNLTGAKTVSFGGIAATSFTAVNNTTITAVVANGASGAVMVTTDGGSASLPGFTFNFPTGLPGVNVSSNVLLIYPNPSKNLITVTHPVVPKTSSISIIDMYGRIVKEFMVPKNESKSQLSIQVLSSGVYKILWTDEKNIHSGLFFKN